MNVLALVLLFCVIALCLLFQDHESMEPIVLLTNMFVHLQDDPLSALDSHVGSQVFEEGFQGWLRAENRTIILVTHQLKHIEEADFVSI